MARSLCVGPTGRAIGVDATAEMLALARTHADQAGATNVEFLHGRIEGIPLPDAPAQAAISGLRPLRPQSLGWNGIGG